MTTDTRGSAAEGAGVARAALIVVNFGSSALLTQTLGSMTLPPTVDVVVVDCWSSDDERRRVAALCDRQAWDSVMLPDNRGFGGGVNAGVAHALAQGVDVVATLNPDATMDADSLRRIIDTARAQPTALVSPRIVTGEGRAWFEGADLYLDDGTSAAHRRRLEHGERPRREWATGASFAMSSALWRRVGGFDEDYFLYWEDIDLSHRVLDAGGQLLMMDDAMAIHDEGQTHGRHAADRAKSEIYYYYNIRNRLLYAAKNLDDERLAAWLAASRRVSYQILLQGGRRQLLGVKPWRAYARGLRDGRACVKRLRG